MGWWVLSGILGIAIGRLSCRPPRGLVNAHKRLGRLYWRWISRSPPGQPRGRPPIDIEMVALIRRMKTDNPTWGAPRIHGELLKLGFRIAQSTVSKYLRALRDQPVPGWKLFLRDHAADIAAIDMMTVRTLTFRTLYAVVVVGLDRRRILHVEATGHPTAAWLALQITEAFPWDQAPPHLIRDNDRAYGSSFRRRLAAMGIRDKPITPYSPWQNGYVERLIGSIRRECLDHVIITDQAHLRRVLKAYADYYNNDRTHLGLDKDSPNGRAVEPHGRIVAEPMLGGVHHRYRRIPGR